MIALITLIIIAIFQSQIVKSIILGSSVMDKYKFIDPSTVKAFKLPMAYPEGFKFTPPKLPADWGDKGVDGQQKIAAQFSALVTTILIIVTILAVLYMVFKKCKYVSSLPRVCFPIYSFSTIL